MVESASFSADELIEQASLPSFVQRKGAVFEKNYPMMEKNYQKVFSISWT